MKDKPIVVVIDGVSQASHYDACQIAIKAARECLQQAEETNVQAGKSATWRREGAAKKRFRKRMKLEPKLYDSVMRLGLEAAFRFISEQDSKVAFEIRMEEERLKRGPLPPPITPREEERFHYWRHWFKKRRFEKGAWAVEADLILKK